MTSLWAAALARARAAPHRSALWTPQGTLTWGALAACAEALTLALRRAGTRPDRPIALTLTNGASFVPALLAMRRLGLPVALVSPLYQAGELRVIADGTGLAAMLTTKALAGKLASTFEATRMVEIAAGDSLPPLALLVLEERGIEPPPAREDTALIKFSSGSTGVPKGIALTDDNLAAEAANIAATMSLSADDRILATVPLCHSYGFDLGVLALLHSGATLVLPDFFVPRRIVADLAEHAASVFLGVPDMYRRWLEQAPGGEPPDLPRLRYLLSCTAPLDAALIRALHARTGLAICQHYGSSETGAVALHNPGEVLARADSVGRAMHGVELRIVGADGVPVACGEEGEVVVSSRAVARGYVLGAPERGNTLAGGSFRTGDLGVLDGDGFLRLRGRRDEVINIDGHKVSPAEVRAALERHPAVREAAVIAIASPAGRPRIAAAVTLRGAATAAEIRAHCYRELAAYKVPERIEIRAELPRGASGKLRLRPEDFAAFE